MASGDIEIEIKLPLKNADTVRTFLNKNGTSPKSSSQKDTYYNHPGRDFLLPKHPFEWLRIRETARTASITYKHYRPDGAEVHDYADEFETKLEKPAQMHKILLNLGFREIAVVDKSRDTWEFRDVEVALDDVNGIGQFIEAESLKQFPDPKEGRRYLFAIVKEIGAECGPEETYGYPYMVLAKKGHKFNRG